MELTGLRITATSEFKSGQMNVQKDWKGLNGAGAEGGGGFAGRWTRSWTSLARGECNPPPQLSPRSSSWSLLCHLSAGGEVAAREENSSSSWTIYFFRSRAAYIPMPISGRSPQQPPHHAPLSPFPPYSRFIKPGIVLQQLCTDTSCRLLTEP